MPPLRTTSSMVLLLEFTVDIHPHQLRFIKAGSLASLGNDVQAAVSKLAKYLMVAVKWIVRQTGNGLVGLWRFSRIQELLDWIGIRYYLS